MKAEKAKEFLREYFNYQMDDSPMTKPEIFGVIMSVLELLEDEDG